MQNITLWFTKKIYSNYRIWNVIFGLGTAFAYAQQQQNGAPNPVQNVQQLQDVLCTFIVYFFWIVITISVIMILYAAFTYVTARDDQEKTSRARRTITYAALGIARCASLLWDSRISSAVYSQISIRRLIFSARYSVAK